MLHKTDRREFLSIAGAAAFGAAGVFAQPPKGKPQRVDVHHHFVPPKHAERILSLREMGRPPQWSAEMSLDQMEKNAVATSMISIVQPGIWFGNDEESRTLARLCNDYGTQMAKDHPGRFGLFAALPLPDVDGCLKEIEYAFDTLKAPGVGILTQHDGKYLGDEAFWPVWAELNRRKAIIYVHPTQPACCTGLVKNVTVGTIEFATDSTRTIASILFSGAAAKFPDIRWIFSHGGGTMPFLLSRFERLAADRKDPFMPNGVVAELKKFYYEIAQANHPGALDALLKIAPLPNILFGSDYPFRPVSEAVDGVTKYSGFSAAQRRAIDRENALRMMPQLRS